MLTSLECSSWHTKDASIGGIKKFPVSITKASQMVQRPTPTKTVPSALLAAGSLPTRSTACDRSTSISTAHHASSASPEKSTSSKWTKILVCTSMTALLRIPASFAVSLFGSVDLSLMTHKFYWPHCWWGWPKMEIRHDPINDCEEEDYDAPHVDVDAVKANLKVGRAFDIWLRVKTHRNFVGGYRVIRVRARSAPHSTHSCFLGWFTTS